MAAEIGWTHGDYIGLFTAIASILVGIAVTLATYRGPIVAVRESEERRTAAERRSHQMAVFRLMMGNLYDVRTPNFVSGLNLIQVEFSNSPAVMRAFGEFLENFHANKSTNLDIHIVRQKSVIKLLAAMGSELGYNLEQMDLMEQVYAPESWNTVDQQQQAIRVLFSDIAAGRKKFPVSIFK